MMCMNIVLYRGLPCSTNAACENDHVGLPDLGNGAPNKCSASSRDETCFKIYITRVTLSAIFLPSQLHLSRPLQRCIQQISRVLHVACFRHRSGTNINHFRL